MDIYFSLWVIHLILSLFCCSVCSSFGHRELLRIGSFVLLTRPSFFKHFLSGSTRCSRLILYFLSQLWNQPLLHGALDPFSGYYTGFQHKWQGNLVGKKASFQQMVLKQLDIWKKKNFDSYLPPYTKINLKCIMRRKCKSWNHDIFRKEHRRKIFATLE